MGKRQKIRSSAGDLIRTPGPLHKQIEKANLAKTKFKPTTKQFHKEQEKVFEKGERALEDEYTEDDLEFDSLNTAVKPKVVNFDLSSKIPEEEKQWKPDEAEIKHERFKKRDKANADASTEDDLKYHGLDPAVVKLYSEVGQVLEKYRSGKVPKAFKVIPSLLNWEIILELTCPDKWTSAVMLLATKMFSTTGTPAQCQKFYNLILLPRIRDEIDEFKKLHFHMYQCLFQAMFKPAAFFKGILLPLCRSGTSTLREAVVFGSVLRKVSIPQMHAAAAMLSIAEMDYSGTNSHILCVLIEKNYTLPFRVLDGLMFHFLRMRSHPDDLPVIWHQSLLAFVERYAKDISSEQREALLDLAKTKSHYQITPEIQRILRNTESRNEESEANMPAYAKEDEMDI